MSVQPSPEAAFEASIGAIFERPEAAELLIPVSSGITPWELVAGEVDERAPYFAEFSIALLRGMGQRALYRVFATDGEVVLETAYNAGQHTVRYAEPTSQVLLGETLPTRPVHHSHHDAMSIALSHLILKPDVTVLWAGTLDRTPLQRPKAA